MVNASVATAINTEHRADEPTVGLCTGEPPRFTAVTALTVRATPCVLRAISGNVFGNIHMLIPYVIRNCSSGGSMDWQTSAKRSGATNRARPADRVARTACTLLDYDFCAVFPPDESAAH